MSQALICLHNCSVVHAWCGACSLGSCNTYLLLCVITTRHVSALCPYWRTQRWLDLVHVLHGASQAHHSHERPAPLAVLACRISIINALCTCMLPVAAPLPLVLHYVCLEDFGGSAKRLEPFRSGHCSQAVVRDDEALVRWVLQQAKRAKGVDHMADHIYQPYSQYSLQISCPERMGPYITSCSLLQQ